MGTGAVAVAVGLLVATGVTGCSSKDKTATTTSTTAASGSSTSTVNGTGSTLDTATTTTVAPTGTKVVEVYFSHEGTLAASNRSVAGPGYAKAAVAAVLAGPNADESSAGLTSAVPVGTKVLGVNIAGGKATVDLSSQFTSGGGSLSMQLRTAQVVYTLTQFDGVRSVDFHIDGKAVSAIGGEGITAAGAARKDFEGVTPTILVNSPAAGAKVAAKFTAKGLANTFEATVVWAVVGADGTQWATGHGQATAGSGTWGTYALSIDVGTHSGDATLKVFEEDAESGGERSAVEVPITVG